MTTIYAWCGCGRYGVAVRPCVVCERATCDVCRPSILTRWAMCPACRRGRQAAPIAWRPLAAIGAIILAVLALEILVRLW